MTWVARLPSHLDLAVRPLSLAHPSDSQLHPHLACSTCDGIRPLGPGFAVFVYIPANTREKHLGFVPEEAA